MMPTTFRFRGFAEIASGSYRAHGSWPGCECMVTQQNISISVPGYIHTHRKPDLVELRWWSLPIPTLMVIGPANGDICLSSFETLRWNKLRTAVLQCGYAFTEQKKFCPFRQFRRDRLKYGFIKGMTP